MAAGGKLVTATKVDDYTVKFNFPRPTACSWSAIASTPMAGS